MKNPIFERYQRHIGHNVEVVAYGEDSVAIECMDCHIVLADAEAHEHPETDEELENRIGDVLKENIMLKNELIALQRKFVRETLLGEFQVKARAPRALPNNVIPLKRRKPC